MTFPWPSPLSHYDDDGPRSEEPCEFTMDGATMRVTATTKTGCDTGRTRFRVECLTCGEVIHPATTGSSSRCRQHLKDKHNLEVSP